MWKGAENIVQMTVEALDPACCCIASLDQDVYLRGLWKCLADILEHENRVCDVTEVVRLLNELTEATNCLERLDQDALELVDSDAGGDWVETARGPEYGGRCLNAPESIAARDLVLVLPILAPDLAHVKIGNPRRPGQDVFLPCWDEVVLPVIVRTYPAA